MPGSLRQVFLAGLTQKSAPQIVHSQVGPWGFIHESFAGAWQRNVEIDNTQTILSSAAVYSCVSTISRDIAKLRIKLMQSTAGIWSEADSAAFSPVLRKPNRWQTRFQFIEQWVLSKLLYGNAYILKERDARVVVALYPLHPRHVTALVTSEGDVYYQIGRDDLAQVGQQITVPASEIIHDRMAPLFHPLVGISPIFACGLSATQANRIQLNATAFFQNASRPSGQLTSPGTIDDVTALRLKAEFESNFGANKIGRLFVSGDGLKYEPMTIPAVDSQLIEQLRFTVEDVARAFGVPLYKIASGPIPTNTNVEALESQYFSGTLQSLVEALELCLDDGLSLPRGYCTEFDLRSLMRMDTVARYEALAKAVGAGWMAPNEARALEDLQPVAGGQTPYLQQQCWSLADLDRRGTPPALPGEKRHPGIEESRVRSLEHRVQAMVDGLPRDRRQTDEIYKSMFAGVPASKEVSE